ncbi:MAG: GNAT family N-acetyltransferase [Streptosporangiaceae bacterium]|jgi:GNAT superfamily N-acetyltransferase
MTLRLRIAVAERTATKNDVPTVMGLIEKAREWLATKGTDQWAKPYPDEDGKLARVQEGIDRGETFIVWDEAEAAATVTIKTERNRVVWSEQTTHCDLATPAVYVHRLITAPDYAGLGLGAELIDWAGLRGWRSNRAEWVRLDAWTTNLALHKYYLGTGFEDCGRYQDDPLYRSGALFQKPVTAIEPANLHIPHFTGSAADFALPDTRAARPDRPAGPAGPPRGDQRRDTAAKVSAMA